MVLLHKFVDYHSILCTLMKVCNNELLRLNPIGMGCNHSYLHVYIRVEKISEERTCVNYWRRKLRLLAKIKSTYNVNLGKDPGDELHLNTQSLEDAVCSNRCKEKQTSNPEQTLFSGQL